VSGASQRLIGVIISLLVAGAVQAQTLRDRDPDLTAAKRIASELQDASFHSGPFYLWSRVRLANAGYNEQGFLPTGDDSGGLTVRVEAPQRFYFVPRRKIVFTAEVTPGYNLLTNDDEDSKVDYLARGDVHFLFNHLYLDLYTSRADQLRALLAANELARTRDDETGVAGEFKYSSRTSVQFAARYRDQSYPEDRFDEGDIPLALLDRNERNGRVSFVHKTFPLTSLFVSAEASDYQFDTAPAKDSSRRWVGAGFHLNNGRSSVRVEAGPATLEFDDPTQRNFSGMIGSAAAMHSSGHLTYNAGIGRDVGFAILPGNNYYVADSANAGLSWATTRRLTLRTGVVAERHHYDVPVAGIRRRDTISFSSVGFDYGIRKFRFGADAGWYERDTTTPGGDDSGIRYVLHLSFVP
jgi:hypothetical protein